MVRFEEYCRVKTSIKKVSTLIVSADTKLVHVIDWSRLSKVLPLACHRPLNKIVLL